MEILNLKEIIEEISIFMDQGANLVVNDTATL
jgi:hypothetical protein